MKLGLVRHFRVDIKRKPFLSSNEFENEMRNYDVSPTTNNGLTIVNDDWEICYSSTLPRAVETVKAIYKGEIVFSDHLIEVPISAFVNTTALLPGFCWHIGSRIAWYFNLNSQEESRNQTIKRISKFLTIIEKSEHKNILIVTHGFFMKALINELKKRGFKGSVDFAPENGKLYVYQK